MIRGPNPVKVQQWTERFARFANSNRTVTQFCLDESVTEGCFYQWKRKLGIDLRSRRRRNSTVNGFQPVSLKTDSICDDVIIRIPGGIEIVLGNNLPAVQLVVQELLDRPMGGGGLC